MTATAQHDTRNNRRNNRTSMPPHLKEPIKTPEQETRRSQPVPSTTLIPNQSIPRTREPRREEQRELHQNLLIHRQTIPDVQTSPSRSIGEARNVPFAKPKQPKGKTREAKRPAGGARAPLRSAAMRKKHRRGSRVAPARGGNVRRTKGAQGDLNNVQPLSLDGRGSG